MEQIDKLKLKVQNQAQHIIKLTKSINKEKGLILKSKLKECNVIINNKEECIKIQIKIMDDYRFENKELKNKLTNKNRVLFKIGQLAKTQTENIHPHSIVEILNKLL